MTGILRPLCTLLLLVALFSQPLAAATIVVTNLNDSGAGSLRQAIATAASGDTIEFAVRGTITLTSGPITISTQNLTIKGPGAEHLTIAGSGSQIFIIQTGAGSTTIQYVKLTNGSGSNGGAIAVNTGGLNLLDSVITNSSASLYGGAVYQGAGAGAVNIYRSELSNNSAAYGGAVCSDDNFIGIAILSSTISGNVSNSNGKAAFARSVNGTVTLNGVTITANTGNGAALYTDAGYISLRNSLIANNPTNAAADLDDNGGTGVIISSNYNVVANDVTGVLLGVDPQDQIGNPAPLTVSVDILNDNGGQTRTHNVFSAFFIANKIPTAASNNAADFDQRFYARAGDYDIGALELSSSIRTDAPVLLITGVPTASTSLPSFTARGTVTDLGPGVNQYGLIWHTSSTLDISTNTGTNIVSASPTPGSEFTHTPTLSYNTTYYVRSFARRSTDSAYFYGPVLSVTTPNVSNIGVSGNSTAIGTGDTTPSATDHTDFGSAAVAGGQITRVFTISNTGSATLTLSSYQVSNTTDFAVIAPLPSANIGSGGNTTISVRFDPASTGLKSSTVTINSNDPDVPIFTFTIQATGTEPNIGLSGNSVSIVSGDATPSSADHTDFGTALLTGGQVVRTFTISNTGNATLNISNVSLSGGQAADFNLGSTPTTVSASGTQTFTVTFDPSARGARATTVTIASDDADTPSYTFAIQGTGIEPATLTTSAATGITSTTASVPANITDDGGSTVTERGVVYSTATAPDITDGSDVKVTDAGTGTGSYTASLTSLTANTPYYARAYAITAAGTAYGNEITFTTLQVYALTVAGAGNGSGGIASNSGGISATWNGTTTSGTTSANFDSGTVVQLTATPNANANFSGWSGSISSTDNPVNVTMDAAKSVTATFARKTGTFSVTLVNAPSGGGWSLPTKPADYSGDASGTTNYSNPTAVTGDYQVSGTAVTGWNVEVSPATTQTLAEAGTAAFTVTYTRQTGTLTVNIDAGASGNSFSISGPSDFNGGSALTGQTADFSQSVPTGDYTVTFSDSDSNFTAGLTRNAAPAGSLSVNFTLTEGATETFAGTYTRKAGTLDIDMVNAPAGAAWTLDTKPADYSGTTTSGSDYTNAAAESGTYNLSASTPTTHSVIVSPTGDQALADGGTIDYTVTYTRKLGTLNVTLIANGSGGSFSISGPADFNGGAPLGGQMSNYGQNVPTGSYTVTGAAVSGWQISVVPAGPQELAEGGTLNVTVTYTQMLGNLRVTLGPDEAVAAGAAWRRNGGSYRGSGESENGLPVGSYTVEFLDIPGWAAPEPMNIEVNNGETTQVNASYVSTAATAAIHYFLAEPAVISAGGSTVLRWNASGADRISIDGIDGDVPPNGSMTVSPASSRRYYLRAESFGNETTAFLRVEVIPAVSIDFFASTMGERPVRPGDEIQIQWRTRGARRLQLLRSDGGRQELDGESGELALKLTRTTGFTLIATGGDGKSQRATFTAPVDNRPRILSFTADDQATPIGGETVLRWLVDGADTITLDGDPVGVSGQRSVDIPATTLFTLTAGNEEGSVSQTLEIRAVEAPAQLTIAFAGASAPAAAISVGSVMSVPLRIANEGPGTARAIVVRLEDGDSAREVAINRLRAGDEKLIAIPWTPLSAGAVKLTATVDPDGAIAESNENDNEAILRRSVSAIEIADVTVAGVQVERMAETVLKVRFELVNVGGRATPPFQWYAHLQPKPDRGEPFGADDLAIATGGSDGLGAGQRIIVERLVTIPKTWKKFWFHGLVDVWGVVSEENKANNSIVIGYLLKYLPMP